MPQVYGRPSNLVVNNLNLYCGLNIILTVYFLYYWITISDHLVQDGPHWKSRVINTIFQILFEMLIPCSSIILEIC